MSPYKTDEEVERILNHELNRTRITSIGPNGSKLGLRKGEERGPNKTTEEKAELGTLARLLGSKATGELVGLSRSQVSRYARGKDTYNNPDKEIKVGIETNLQGVREKAVANVDFLLDVVRAKGDKLPASKAASAAANMVKVYDTLGPKNPGLNLNGTQVVFYAPRILGPSDYPVIEVEPS